MSRWRWLAGAALVAGALGTALAWRLDARQAALAALAAWIWAFSLALGAIAVALMAVASSGTWIVGLRRCAERVGGALIALAVAAVGLAAARARLWPWAGAPADAEASRAVARLHAWLAPTAVGARAAAILALVVVVAELALRWSVAQDDGDRDGRIAARLRTFAIAVQLPLGLAVSLAAFDWLMSLEPPWRSSALGLELTANALLAGTATLAVVGWCARAVGAVPATRFQARALGELLLAFTILWAYIAYGAYLLTRMADLPHEVPWYARRSVGGWRGEAIGLIAAHALAVLVLLARRVRASWPALAAVAAWLMAWRAVDLHWLTVPAGGGAPRALDAAPFALAGGGVALVAGLRARRRARTPVGDPRVAASLAEEAA